MQRTRAFPAAVAEIGSLDAGESMRPRIYADENDKTEDDFYMLHITGSLRDIERYRGQLHAGMRVLFNVQDEFEVEGTLHYDTARKMWLGRPDYSTGRDL